MHRLIGGLERTTHSFSISAPNNFGKSDFLRQLSAVCATTSEILIPVYVDCNLAAGENATGFYEVVLRNLLPNIEGPTAAALSQPYRQLLSASQGSGEAHAGGFEASRAFLEAMEVSLTSLPTHGKKKLVLFLDQFDRFIQTLPSQAFRYLRALKEKYPQRLSFVTATRLPVLAMGREDEEDLAEFYELFEGTGLIRLRGLSQPEAEGLALAVAPGLSAQRPGRLYRLAGGHPGLTRLAALRLAELYSSESSGEKIGQWLEEDFEYLLRTDPLIRLECRRIWRSLPRAEQRALLQWREGVRERTADPLLGTLEERGLIRAVGSENGEQEELFAELFAWFIQDLVEEARPEQNILADNSTESAGTWEGAATSAEAGEQHYSVAGESGALAYDPYREVVFFERGQRKLALSGNQALLFKYLYLRQSLPYCGKDELISAVWGAQSYYSSENLDRLVSDLRQQLGDSEKQTIRTVHRRGYQMVGVAEWHG